MRDISLPAAQLFVIAKFNQQHNTEIAILETFYLQLDVMQYSGDIKIHMTPKKVAKHQWTMAWRGTLQLHYEWCWMG